MKNSFFAIIPRATPSNLWAVECTNSISAEGYDFPNKYPEYVTKPADGEAPIQEFLGKVECTFISITPRSTC